MADSKPPVSFLSLPRELRQKIIFDTYDDDVEQKQMGSYIFSTYDLMFMDYDDERGEPGRGSYSTRFFLRLLGAANTWTAALKEVHEEMKEDVDYVVERVGWINLLHNLTEK